MQSNLFIVKNSIDIIRLKNYQVEKPTSMQKKILYSCGTMKTF